MDLGNLLQLLRHLQRILSEMKFYQSYYKKSTMSYKNTFKHAIQKMFRNSMFHKDKNIVLASCYHDKHILVT